MKYDNLADNEEDHHHKEEDDSSLQIDTNEIN